MTINNGVNVKTHLPIHATRLGLAGGILWGVSAFILTLLAANTGYSADWMKMFESMYPGYHVSNEGSIIGLLYGFLDGFIMLFLLGWLYNLLGGCCCKCDSKCDMNLK